MQLNTAESVSSRVLGAAGIIPVRPEGDGPPVVDVGTEEGGVAEGRVVVGHAGGGGVGEQQGGEMPERVGREA